MLRFLRDESGYTVETLVWSLILGLGGAAVAFGVLTANRYQGGGVKDDLSAVMTPSSLPRATEQVSQLQAGYTGAITEITVQ